MRQTEMNTSNRIHRISLRELVVGIVIAVVGFGIEVLAFDHHPDIRVFISHLMEPIVAAVVFAVLAGLSWPAAWAFFMSSVKALAALTVAFLVVGGLTALAALAARGSLLAIVILGVVAGVFGAFLLASVLFIKALRHPFPELEDDDNPFITWTWGIPLPKSRMPGHGFDNAQGDRGHDIGSQK